MLFWETWKKMAISVVRLGAGLRTLKLGESIAEPNHVKISSEV